MVEIIAAGVGALIGIGSSTLGSLYKKDSQNATTIARLTAAVEHIAGEISLMREEMRDDRVEMFGRLGNCEQRVAALEARSK